MFRRDRLLCVVIFIGILLTLTLPIVAQSETLVVSPTGPYATIEDALADADAGDTIEVHGGVYPAPLYIEHSVALFGVDNPVIDGNGDGSIVIINAPDVIFEGFIIRNTGTQMHHEDSGIIIQADNVVVADNLVENVLFGIYFADADNGIARNNIIRGRIDLDIALRGDGIRVWFSNNVTLEGNEIENTRDTLIWYADGINILNNNFHNNRYGLHFMYSSDATVNGNQFEDNHVGTYMMYSQGLTMQDNVLSNNHGPSGYGLALKDMDEVVVTGNVLSGNRAGIYLDNSPSRYEGNNLFQDNLLAYNDLGVIMQPSVERNLFQLNSFLENIQQASTRGRGDLQGNIWTQDGIGNYWSDYVGYDSNSDGVGDMPYRSEKLFENLSDAYPNLRFFIYSPASQAIDFAAAAFPSIRPEPKLIDDAPLTQYSISQLSSSGASVSPQLFIFSLILMLIGSLPFVLTRRQGQAFHRTSLKDTDS